MKKIIPWWIRIPAIFILSAILIEFFIDSGDKPAFVQYPVVLAFLGLILMVLIVTELILRAVENVMFNTLTDEAKERYLEEKTKKLEWKWGKKTYKKLLGSKPIEEEGEIVLDHNYDGIRELDNNLPPWWTYLFYATIVFAIVYLVRFEIYNDYNQDDEYNTKLAEAQIEIDEYKKTAKGMVDVNTVELLSDASDINTGKEIYSSNCVACHMPDGGGGIGPNLTDKNWILGGGIKNVFNTISEGGRDGKGMVAWKQILNPLQRAQVTSFVLSLQGNTPANPKAAEGDVWEAEE